MELKEARLKMGYSKNKAASICGINIRTYRKYEEDPNSCEENKKRKLITALLESEVASLPVISTESDDFAFLRENHCLYVDKTGLIEELLDSRAYAVLFCRPRRFGKSLTLSTLRHFFSVASDSSSLFEGLSISKRKDLCTRYQNAFPVIDMNLKDVEATSFSALLGRISTAICYSAGEHAYLLSSEKLGSEEKALVERYCEGKASQEEMESYLSWMSQLLFKHFGRKSVVLIDEYDVPLHHASRAGYYDEALLFMNNLLSGGLKSNRNLFLGVLSGCLKIAKESTFTGLNNVSEFGIASPFYSSYFGFTEKEVSLLLDKYGLSHRHDLVKSYYDGFRFGNEEIYCPFDVCHFLKDHRQSDSDFADPYWANSSENPLIGEFLANSTAEEKADFDSLLQGESIRKNLDMEVTYRHLGKDVDSLYAVFAYSGYLRLEERLGESEYRLGLPNLEVKGILSKANRLYGSRETRFLASNKDFLSPIFEGKTDEMEALLGNALSKIASIHDYARPYRDAEAFYHGFLLGLLEVSDKTNRYQKKSNPESGLGHCDIALFDPFYRKGVIIEVKLAKGGDFASAFKEGEAQIKERSYENYFKTDTKVKSYVYAFYKKEVRIERIRD